MELSRREFLKASGTGMGGLVLLGAMGSGYGDSNGSVNHIWLGVGHLNALVCKSGGVFDRQRSLGFTHMIKLGSR